MTQRLRIGLVGCGEMGLVTARDIVRSKHAAHVMVMDRDPQLAQEMGATYGVPHTTDLSEMLANPRVDAVYIAVPHHLHASTTMDALRAGKHVLVEKPIATTLADADAMIAAANAGGRVLSVAYRAQFDGRLRAARRLIAEGAIGKVIGTRIVARLDKPAGYWASGYTGRASGDWRMSWAAAGGGVLAMNASHNLNTMRFVTGLEVDRVFSDFDTYSTQVEVEDFIALIYRYRNGALGTLEAGSAMRGGDPGNEVDRIYGETGQVLLGPVPQVYVIDEFERLAPERWQPIEPDDGDRSSRLDPVLVDVFARATLKGEPAAVTGEDGRAILEVVLAAYQSARGNRQVWLPIAE